MSHNKPLSREGRIMALDLGDKRIGVAISDPTRIIAKPLLCIDRKSRNEDFTALREIVRSEGVIQIIVGLPIPLSGVEGARSRWARDYASELSKSLDIQTALWDESFSTKDAEESLRLRGIDPKSQRSRIDAIAAALILQDYLDDQESMTI